MKRTIWQTAAITLLIGAAAVTRAEEHQVFATPLKGVVAHGRAFACLEGGGAGLLRYAALAGGPARESPACADVSEPPCAWQVSYGHYWVSSSSNLGAGAFGPTDSLQRYRLDDLLDGKLIPGPGADPLQGADFIPPDSMFSPLGQARSLVWPLLNGKKYPFQLFFDYWPVGEDKVLLFQLCNVAGADQARAKPDKVIGDLALVHLPDRNDPKFNEPDWSLAVFSFKNAWDPKEKDFDFSRGRLDDRPLPWRREGNIAVGFRERFRVLGKGDDYYFVTASGKLYRAPKPDEGADRRMDTVWNDEKRPVVAFITDADADRTFLFCKPDQDGKGVYFEMGDKPDPRPYDAGKVPAAKPDDPLPAVLAYAKILVADKKIKGKGE